MKTTNYEISKKLAEAGFKSEHDFSWYKNESGKKLLNYGRCWTVTFQDSEERILDYYEFCFPAYDLETILEALPPKIENKNKFLGDWQLEITKEWIEYCYYYHCQSDVDKDSMFSCIKLHNESLADAAARLWLKLKQEGLV